MSVFTDAMTSLKKKTEQTFIVAFSAPFVHFLYCIDLFFPHFWVAQADNNITGHPWGLTLGDVINPTNLPSYVIATLNIGKKTKKRPYNKGLFQRSVTSFQHPPLFSCFTGIHK